ncbi:ERMES complex subunit [Tieghemiomyces parasiticus]|uniref:Mitochondrial distribution and morphology protein 34 n=1 Tax=Tieghemiomyces parasiticus TaxID=78921 RepID=A0A9W8A6E2_9FUNG|nr:ERMES complex subunit [Tieghemiomyces parasiticus]
MSFKFSWSGFSDDFCERARQLLTNALNSGSLPDSIVDRIVVKELNLGTQPPELEILDVTDLTDDRFAGQFRLAYTGDAHLLLQTKVQVNPMKLRRSEISLQPRFGVLAADQPLVVPMLLRISHVRLHGTVGLAVSKQHGVNIAFKKSPLESILVSSTFDDVPQVRNMLQREIETQLRVLFLDNLPHMIHELSLRHLSQYRTEAASRPLTPPPSSHPHHDTYPPTLPDPFAHRPPRPRSKYYSNPPDTWTSGALPPPSPALSEPGQRRPPLNPLNIHLPPTEFPFHIHQPPPPPPTAAFSPAAGSYPYPSGPDRRHTSSSASLPTTGTLSRVPSNHSCSTLVAPLTDPEDSPPNGNRGRPTAHSPDGDSDSHPDPATYNLASHSDVAELCGLISPQPMRALSNLQRRSWAVGLNSTDQSVDSHLPRTLFAKTSVPSSPCGHPPLGRPWTRPPSQLASPTLSPAWPLAMGSSGSPELRPIGHPSGSAPTPATGVGAATSSSGSISAVLAHHNAAQPNHQHQHRHPHPSALQQHAQAPLASSTSYPDPTDGDAAPGLSRAISVSQIMSMSAHAKDSTKPPPFGTSTASIASILSPTLLSPRIFPKEY